VGGVSLEVKGEQVKIVQNNNRESSEHPDAPIFTPDQLKKAVLERHTSREVYRAERLDQLSELAAEQQNAWVEANFGIKGLLDKTGALSTTAFNKFHGGPLTSADEYEHRDKILEREKVWAAVKRGEQEDVEETTEEGAIDPEDTFQKLRNFKLTEAGVDRRQLAKELGDNPKLIEKRENELLLAYWRAEKRFEQSRQLEAVFMVVLNKIVGDKFLVVRSNTYDDYLNGVDTMIIDKETGDVVCTLDEVRGTQVRDAEGNLRMSDREERKRQKIAKNNLRGGKKIAYGIGFEKDEKTNKKKLYRGEVKNLPILYVSVPGADLGRMIDELTSSGAKPDAVSYDELKFFDQMIDALYEQIDNLIAQPSSKGKNGGLLAVQERAKKLLQSLAKMEEMRARKFPHR
jgi:hypothetical protein